MTSVPTTGRRSRAPRPTVLVLLTVLAFAAVTAAVLLVPHEWTTGSPSSAPVRGSGVAASEARALPPFGGVDLAGANTVLVHVGARQSVVVHADDNLLRKVTTRVRYGELVIANRGSFTTSSPMHVEVIVPALGSATLSGAGTVVVDGVHGDRLAVRVHGAGTLRVDGTATRVDATLSGTGEAQLGGLTARDVTAEVSGTGTLEVRATRMLDASVTGTGTISYAGDPRTVTRSVTGTGAIVAG
jgi:hypothetical protein